ncbi:hypothetical protein [Rickettsia amblyommatis]|uniref:Uncharacterized protein n=2 Tax=Rickettsia amblyommatis TaxID=33989 RepID=H8K3F1_RICAG|nr:hypothetical protein [Rickettsia amblyommatis]AFC70343.1 hypothetical protein MCE_07930 [Rickettsia amblyommatis str. GAT-30V]KJV61206.1 putative membrane protein [Rickettsia amblyommatis str. Ac/Pa]
MIQPDPTATFATDTSIFGVLRSVITSVPCPVSCTLLTGFAFVPIAYLLAVPSIVNLVLAFLAFISTTPVFGTTGSIITC